MSWFPHAPRYRETGSGRVTIQGNFDTVSDETRYSRVEQFWRAGGSLGKKVSIALRKSYVYNNLVSPFRNLSEEDVQLFLAIVAQSRDAAALQYPRSEFHVILWDNMFRQRDFLRFLPQVLAGFRKQGMRVHLLSDIIPDYKGSAPNEKYESLTVRCRIATTLLPEQANTHCFLGFESSPDLLHFSCVFAELSPW